jgi:hypothetical protein
LVESESHTKKSSVREEEEEYEDEDEDETEDESYDEEEDDMSRRYKRRTIHDVLKRRDTSKLDDLYNNDMTTSDEENSMVTSESEDEIAKTKVWKIYDITEKNPKRYVTCV